jgi:hypothetical protein
MSDTPKRQEFLGLAITFYPDGKLASFQFTVGKSAILLALIFRAHLIGLNLSEAARQVAALLK